MAEETTSSESFLNPSRRSYVYESSKSTGNKKRVLLIIIGVIILIALIAYAIIATGGKGESEQVLTPTPTIPVESPTPTTPIESPTPKISPTATPKVSITPTPKVSPTGTKGTPTPSVSGELERSSLKVAVLNGSGIAGAATKASDTLKKLGYDVVSSGNADNYDYVNTQIQVTSAKKSYLDLMKKDLANTYTIGAATADYTGTEADALVIVGKN